MLTAPRVWQGYEYNIFTLLNMTSLIDATSIQNYGVIVLRNRREFRIKYPKLLQSRIVGLFETSLYLGDRTLRHTEQVTKDKFTLLPASALSPSVGVSAAAASSPAASSRSVKTGTPTKLAPKRPPRRALIRGATLGRFALPEFGVDSEKPSPDKEPSKEEQAQAAKLAATDSMVLPNTTVNKRTGFTKQVRVSTASRRAC